MTELTYLPTEQIWHEWDESDMWNKFLIWYFGPGIDTYATYNLNSDMMDIS